MAFMDKMLKAIGYTKESRVTPLISSQYEYTSVASNFSDYESYQKAVKRISWVFACVWKVATSMAKTKWYLLDQEDKEISSGDVYNLLKRPNPYESYNSFLMASLYDLELTGNVFWTLEQQNMKGQPKWLYHLDPKRMVVVPDPTNFIGGYIYEVNGRKVAYGRDEIIHIKYPNPLDPYMGMGKIEANQYLYDTEIYAVEYNRQFFKSGARLSGILEAPQDLAMNADQKNRLIQQFRTLYTGARNMHKIALLEGGIKYNSMTLNQKDMEFLNLRNLSMKEICAIFEVPPPKIGVMDNANYKTEEADKTFWEGIASRLSIIEEHIDHIVKLFDPTWKFEFEEVVKENEVQQSEVLERYLKNFVLTPNEVREVLGYPPAPWGNTVWIPFGLDPQKELEDEVPPAAGNVPEPELIPPRGPSNRASMLSDIKSGISNLIDDLSRIPTASDPMPHEVSPPINIDEERNSWKKSFADKADAKREGLIKRFRTDMKNFFNNQEDRILTKLFEVGEVNKVSVERIFPEKQEDRRAEKVVRNHIIDGISLGISNAEDLVGVSKVDGNKKTKKDISGTRLRRIATRLAGNIKGINDTTRQSIQQEIETAMRDDLSINELAYGNPDKAIKGIQGVFDEASDYRAELIARTEITTAYAEGSVETYKDLEIEQIEWVTAGDDRVSEECLSNEDAGPINLGDLFPSGVTQPPQHPNCRCLVMPAKP